MANKFNHLNVPDQWNHYWSRYPQGYTILEALISWVSQVDSMVDNQNELNGNVEQFRKEIDEFVGRFDKRLQDEVTQTLNDWQNSGFLDVVISTALQWELDNYITTNEQDKLSLNTQLQQKADKSTFEQFKLLTNEQLAALVVSVKKFGAVGDGVTDDTASIQDAINAIEEEYYSGVGILGGQTYTATSIRLFFPKGVYRVTNTLVFQKIHHIDFGNAILVLDTTDDIFMIDALSYKARYQGGVFSGEKIFNIHNPNEDQGLVVFEKMEFKDCEVSFRIDTQSTKVVIKECKFDDVVHPLIQVSCDDMQFSNNWCQSNRPIESGSGNIIVERGRLTFRDNILIPLDEVKSEESAWIEFSGGNLMADNNRFSGEVGNRCPVNWKSEGKTGALIQSVGLIFTNNMVSYNSQLEKTSCVRLFKMPNHLYIENNYYGQLINYIVSFTNIALSALETQLQSLKTLFNNSGTGIEGVFTGGKYTVFNYAIKDNGFYLSQKDGNDYFANEREGEWFFLIENYTNNLEYLKKEQVYTIGNKQNAQDIASFQDAYANGNRIVKLPLSGIHRITSLKLKCSWNRNVVGTDYHQVQELSAFFIKTYENGLVTSKICYKNMFENTFDTEPSGLQLQLGVYDKSGNVFFDGTYPPNSVGLCVRFPGPNVSVERISVS